MCVLFIYKSHLFFLYLNNFSIKSNRKCIGHEYEDLLTEHIEQLT